jgi:hypothetical protein
MEKKTPEKPASKPAPGTTTPGSPSKKKLSLDVTDVNEVLERKISP